MIRAADHDVAARLEADAVVGRSRDGGGVELRELVARAALARVAVDRRCAAVVVRRAREVHGSPMPLLVAVSRGRSGCRSRR